MSLHHLFESLLHHPHVTRPSVEEEGHVISRRLQELLDGIESVCPKGRLDMPTEGVGRDCTDPSSSSMGARGKKES
jgi:hypothetical protein